MGVVLVPLQAVFLPLLTLPLLLGAVTTSAKKKSPGKELIGTVPPGWGNLGWVNSLPLRFDGLRGKVVLIRWWTDGCPFCAATAPALNRLHSDFADDGLVVIGMYHPKPVRPVSRDVVRDLARELRFEFPVGVDDDWQVLKDWWLATGEREATSVTFLLDKEGRIRLIHPGPQFSLEGEADAVADYRAIRKMVQKLLKERPKD